MCKDKGTGPARNKRKNSQPADTFGQWQKKARFDLGEPIGGKPQQQPLPYPTGVTSGTPDPEFAITSLYTGMGDCIHVKCPDGTNILIDCGSMGGLTGYQNAFQNELIRLLGGNKYIDHLIITHSDADHHNKVKLINEAGIKVGRVIAGCFEWTDLFFKDKDRMDLEPSQIEALRKQVHEMSTDDYLENWNQKFRKRGDTFKSLREAGCKTFVGLTINVKQDDPRVKPEFRSGYRAFDYNTNKAYGDELGACYFEVCKSGDGSWVIKIVAAQVESMKYKDKAAYMNCASLITVIEFGNQRVFFTGDAIGDTLKYLLDSPVSALLDSEIALLQIPHHGSDTNDSNLGKFIEKVKPKNLFASVRFGEEKHCFPKWTALQPWKGVLEKIKVDPKPHYIGYWIERNDLLYKRIFERTDNYAKTKTDEALPKDFIDGVDKFVDEVLSDKDLSKTTLFYGLKEGATEEERRNNLFVFAIQYFETRGDLIFAIQKTPKFIHTNGSTAVNKKLNELIMSKKLDKFRPSRTRKGLIYSRVDFRFNKLIETAFNNLGATAFTLSSTGATFEYEMIMEPENESK